MSDRIVRVILRGDIVGLKAAMAEGAQVVSATANKMTAATKESQKFRSGLMTLGSQAGKVGLVAGAGLAYAVKSAADFSAEMALVRTLSHASASDMDKLSHAALTVGQNIGYSAKSVAQGEEELVKAGVSVKDILGGGLKGALDLAAAGQTDVATATSIAAAAMTEFGLKGKDVPHVADLLAAGADKALGSVEDLGIGLSQAGTTAHQMGLTVEQTVGTLTAFAQAGLLGERGGTTFKMMLLRLADPSKKAQEAMDKYGISLYKANGQIKTMPELAGNLSDALKGISPKARNAALGIIFGSRAIQGANILMANGEKGIQGWITKTNDQGFAAQQASGKLDSLTGDLTKLKSAMQTAFIGVGSGSQGPLRDLTQGATSALDVFNKLPGPVHETAGALLAITAVTGGGLWFGSRVIRSVSDTRAALKALDFEAGTTKVALAGIGKGLEFAAIIEGLSLVDAGLKNLTHSNVDTSKIAGDIQTLGESGRVTGTLLKTFGGDLEHFGKQAANLNSGFMKLQGKAFDWLPGDTATETASKNFSKIDAALASMVSSGHADDAKRAFDDLAAGAAKYGVTVDQLTKFFPAYTDQTARASGAATMMNDALNGLIPAANGVTGATGPMGAAVQQSTADLEAQAKALDESRKAARTTADAFFGVGKSVNDSKVSLNGWISDLEKQSSALNHFTDNVVKAGKRGVREGLIAALEQAGPEGAMRLQQLANASDTEIGRANRAWKRGELAIDRYVNVVGGVPPIVATDLQVNGVPVAISAVAALKRLMDSLHDRNINIKVTKTTNATVAEAAANSGKPGKTGADGATVPSSGRSYADRWPYLLADGEEVVSDRHGGATKNRSALKAASRGATLAVVGMASGGTAGRGMPVRMTPAGSGASVGMGIDYSRLGTAVALAIGGDRLLEWRDARDAHLAALRTALREVPVQRAQTDPSLLYGVS